ncbi:tellurite resistance TerB family protein [Cereibacter sphaeroides]|uniref:tellurite resistance TerB family protein n=1 Tax=Cereibacter sphaeroides TaxID=1063 RepID=UPI001F16CCF5|nr:tellurite resistance TerB family protein [Cereibacter sphaeroides]MCE6958944.1 tellurite resistance TerB family protein [Cereibacter sphaeroides]MCE6971177.1 tellurite resistance TerB family protein [Cereibacter sphaeroides]
MKNAGFLLEGQAARAVVQGHLQDAGPCCGKGGMADLIAGFLIGDRDRCRLAGHAARRGIVTLSWVVAGRAWADWQAAECRDGSPCALLVEPEAGPSADGLCERLLQAMVAAAKADGRVTREERRQIHRRLRELDLECEAQALIAAELEAPLDPGRIARLARTPEEAAGIYAASLLAAGRGGPAECGYLPALALRLALDNGLVARLHACASALE